MIDTDFRECVSTKTFNCEYVTKNKYGVWQCSLDRITQVRWYSCVPSETKELIKKKKIGDDMIIYCGECECDREVNLIKGSEGYPHRPDLADIPLWICPVCRSFVGCHRKTSNPTAPLGSIPSKAVKRARHRLHLALDPIWRECGMKRSEAYKYVSKELGYNYHTAKIRSMGEADRVFAIIERLKVHTMVI